MSMNSAYIPKRLDASMVRLQNLISTKQVEIPFKLAGESGKLSLTHGLVERDYNLAIQVLVNQVPISVMLDSSLLDWYLIRFEADLGFVDLPSGVQESVILKCVSELIPYLSKALSVPLGLQQIRILDQIPASACACHGLLTVGDQTCAVEFLFGQDAAFGLEKHLGVFPAKAQRPPDQMPVGIHFEKGRTWLSYDSLTGLELFDVILFDQAWDGVLIRTEVGRSFQAQLSYYETSKAIAAEVPGEYQEAQRLAREPAVAGFQIIVEKEVEDSDTLSSPQNVGSVPVVVTFELGRTQLTMGELGALVEGYTFSLSANVQAPVEIRANGKVIGLAELVQVGDSKLGARIVTLQGS